VAQSDEKSRGGSVREASRLSATLGSEPSGGYAYHDKGRVDRVERVERVRPPPRHEDAVPTPQAASHAPKERSFARTLVGGMTIQEALAGRVAAAGQAAANDQARPSARGSWPPMPHVPSDLVGSMDYDDEPSGVSLRETQPGTRAPSRVAPPPEVVSGRLPSSNPPAVAGGAIWQAMPSVVEQPEAAARLTPDPAASLAQDAGRLTSEPARLTPDPVRNSPAPFRPSIAELEAQHAHHYGDARVLAYEALVERNDWEQILERLNAESSLSPTLQLLKIVARRETLKGDEPRESAQLTQQAIACMAQILRLPEASPTALVLGKRVLRKNPSWTKAEARTSRGVSMAIVVSGLSIGAGIGWLITRLLF